MLSRHKSACLGAGAGQNHTSICGLLLAPSHLVPATLGSKSTHSRTRANLTLAGRGGEFWDEHQPRHLSGHSLNPPSTSGNLDSSLGSNKRGDNLSRVNIRASSTIQGYELTIRQGALDKPPYMHRPSGSSELEATPLLLASKLAQQQQADGSTSGQSIASSQRGPQPPITGWQYLVGLCALSVVICYADRSNISTAVLPMAEQFGWDKAFQGVILSTFFSGYALTQVLGGQLADRFGGKLVLAGGVSLWSFFTLITPEAAALGTVPLIASRILLGVGEGVAFPSIHSLIARNVPQASQSTAVGIVTAASYVGTALAFGISPLIISTLGWQYVFYLFAGMALLWLPLWFPVRTVGGSISHTEKRGSDDGATLPLLGTDGAEAGLTSAAGVEPSAASSGSAIAEKEWSRRGFWGLMRRKEVWAICAAQYTGSWGMYGLLNWLPTFFKDYYHIEIADLAAYTLAPYLVQGGLGLMSGVIADKMIASGWSIKSVRIILQTVGMIGPAVCLMLAVSPAVGASPELASQLITIGLGFSALTLGGVSASHLDIAPRHAGVIYGAGNTAATLAGLLSVPFTGYLLQATGSWPLVFGVTAGHYFVGALLWVLWVGDKPLPEDADAPALPARA